MGDSEHNSQIEKVAALVVSDKVSFDEQDPQKLEKYLNYVKKQYHLKDEDAIQVVNERPFCI